MEIAEDLLARLQPLPAPQNEEVGLPSEGGHGLGVRAPRRRRSALRAGLHLPLTPGGCRSLPNVLQTSKDGREKGFGKLVGPRTCAVRPRANPKYGSPLFSFGKGVCMRMGWFILFSKTSNKGSPLESYQTPKLQKISAAQQKPC